MSNPYLNLNQIIAHRGASAYAPENTACAIKKAAKMGASWVEVDINISHEHTPVVFHDMTLERCSNGIGKLTQTSNQTLEKLDFGSWFSPEFKGEPLLSLEALIHLALEYKLALNLEIKPDEGLELEVVVAIKHCLENFANLPTIVFSCFSVKALEQCMIFLSDYPRALLVEAIDEQCESTIKEIEACGLHFDAEKANEQSIKRLVKTGVPLLAYTVNEKELANELFDWGVTAVFSDYPDLLSKDVIEEQINCSQT